MQGFDTITALILAFPAVLIGFIVGRIIGGMESMKVPERVGLILMISALGGIIIAIIVGYLMNFIPITLEFLMSIISLLGGSVFGAVSNWQTPAKRDPKGHIVFEIDDDEEFDREIEEALGGMK